MLTVITGVGILHVKNYLKEKYEAIFNLHTTSRTDFFIGLEECYSFISIKLQTFDKLFYATMQESAVNYTNTTKLNASTACQAMYTYRHLADCHVLYM